MKNIFYTSSENMVQKMLNFLSPNAGSIGEKKTGLVIYLYTIGRIRLE